MVTRAESYYIPRMGELVEWGTERRIPLASSTLVGRSPSAWLRPDTPHVSDAHALIVWRGSRWWVRDLSSTNGTLLDGRRLTAGGDEPLSSGSELVFGAERATYRLESASAPQPVAVEVGTERYVTGDGHVLALEKAAESATLFLDPTQGVWMVELAHGERVTASGRVTVGGAEFLIKLPEGVDETPMQVQRPHLQTTHFTLQVPADPNEKVGIVLRAGRETRRLRLGWPGRLLAVLATAYRDDARRPEEERGWRSTEALAEAMGSSRRGLNVATQRLRQALSGEGLEGAVDIVQVRPGARRLGPVRVEVESA
ncbi:MAG: FHA domain-containing protein [Myxococcota bacterium]